jgi:PadR family transcriptional regulator, regulatory protein PadR
MCSDSGQSLLLQLRKLHKILSEYLFLVWPSICSAKIDLMRGQMKRVYLGEFEEIVLLVVAALEEDAYGVKITHEIIQQTDRSVRLNQVHASLHRLEDKGMIISKMGDPTAERGGRRKRIFTITTFGRQTLRDMKSVRTNLWNLLPSSMKIAEA